MENWKPFFFESNQFFDWVKNLDDWAKLRQCHPNKSNEELLAAKEATYGGHKTLKERNNNPNYGFRWEHDGARTLGDFFRENNMNI